MNFDIELLSCEVDVMDFETALLLLYTAPVYHALDYEGILMKFGHRSFIYYYN
jgi:hypothetical protein